MNPRDTMRNYARDPAVTHLAPMPIYDGIRGNPRFRTPQAKMHLGRDSNGSGLCALMRPPLCTSANSARVIGNKSEGSG
jgi:hypothetical protein